MAAIKYERVVEEDLNLGVGPVNVTMPAGGTVVGHKIGLHSFPVIGVIATHGGGQAITGGAAAETLIYETEAYDPAEDYDATTGIFTAPADGIYAVKAFAQVAAFSGIFNLIIYRNSSAVVLAEITKTAATASINVAADLELEEGDTVTIRATHNDSTNDRNVTAGRLSIMARGIKFEE